MKAYHNSAVLQFDDSTTGNAGAGVPVTVRLNSTQALVSIFDLDEVAISNPTTTNSKGNYAFKTADGVYDIIISEGTSDEVVLEKVQISEFIGLINDLSQAYEFATVAELVANTPNLISNKVANTKGYTTKGDKLGSSYLIQTTAEAIADGVLVDEYQNLTLANGKVATQQNIKAAGIGHKLKLKLSANLGDAFAYVMGDSTGNESTEWVYLTTQYLARKYPQYTVLYYLWDDVTGDYLAPSTVSTGLGANTLHLYNASHPGANAYYFQGDRKTNLYASREFDLILHNLGHNGGTNNDYGLIYTSHLQGVSGLIKDQSNAEVVIVLQNFRTAFEEYSLRAVSAMRDIANLLSLQVIDIYSIFKYKQSIGEIADWMADDVHPNAQGSKAWANAVINQLDAENYKIVKKVNSLAFDAPSIVRDPYFRDFIYSQTSPLNTTPTGCSVEKEVTIQESGTSLKLTGTSGLGNFRLNLTASEIDKLKNSTEIVMMMRVYIPSTNTSSNSGRIFITTDLGGVSSAPQLTAVNEWMWLMLKPDVSILKGATYIRFAAYVNIGDVVYIDRCNIIMGDKMMEPKIQPITLSDYYDPANVLANLTNVISVTGDEVQLLSSSEPTPAFYINAYGMVPGDRYKIEWSSTVGGTLFARDGLGGIGAVLSSTSMAGTSLEYTPTVDTSSFLFNHSGTPSTISALKITKIYSR